MGTTIEVKEENDPLVALFPVYGIITKWWTTGVVYVATGIPGLVRTMHNM